MLLTDNVSWTYQYGLPKRSLHRSPIECFPYLFQVCVDQCRAPNLSKNLCSWGVHKDLLCIPCSESAFGCDSSDPQGALKHQGRNPADAAQRSFV